MKDFITLAVILAVFICAATVATLVSIPVYSLAKGSEVLAVLSVVWMVVAYVACGWVALRVLAVYRRAIGE